MTHDMDSFLCIWADACNAMIYILNRGPHEILKNRTTKEAFTSDKPQVSHFSIVGCHVYIHVCLMKIGLSLNLQASWIYLLVIVRPPKLIGSIFHMIEDTGKLRC